MEQAIALLSPEQAQHALMIFYDLLPGEFWEGGAKPSAVKIESTVEQLQDEASEDMRPVVDALLAEGGEEEKGEAAKAVLSMFYEQQSLREFVDQAAQQAKEPHLAPIPLIVGAVIVILAALPKEMDLKKGQYKFGHFEDLAALMKEFAEFAGKLPAKFYELLLKGNG